MAVLNHAQAKYASIIVDARTGEVLHAKNADTRNHPASLTKIMTLYMIFDGLRDGRLKMNQRLKVSRRAARMPRSKLWLRTGGTITVREAILALVTKSANDVATVVAENLAGSEKAFAKAMTARARALGMSKTTFRNASGLRHSAQLSTARDMATLGLRIRQDFPDLYRYFKTYRFSYNGQTYTNHNRLLRRYEGTDGIKTGYINASGFNLVASVERGDRRLIGVVFGGRTGKSRDKHMRKLLDTGFRKLAQREIRPPDRYAALKAPEVLPVKADGQENTDNPFANARTAATSETKAITGVIASGDHKADTVVWGVQVGAFSSRQSAIRAAHKASLELPIENRDMEITVAPTQEGGKLLFRARLIGGSESEARQSCRLLTARDVPCVPVSLSVHEQLAYRRS